MREILFKGKYIGNGKWVEGFYYKTAETTYCFKEDYERNPIPVHHYILKEKIIFKRIWSFMRQSQSAVETVW